MLFFSRFTLCPMLLAAVPAIADPATDAYREGRAHLAARRFAEAAARFEAAAATTNASAAAAAWFGRGEALYGMKQWDAAAAAYDALLKRQPGSPLAPQALFARGHAEHQAGHLPQALATFNAFERQYPTNALIPACAAAISNLSRTMESQARQQAAAAVARELTEINAAVRAEKFEEARAASERFLMAHPDHPQAALLRYLTAACSYRTRDYARAAESYRAFLARHPQDARAAEARGQLADSLFQTGDYDEARALYDKMAEEASDPQTEARAILGSGDCDAAQKRWDEAQRAYLSIEALPDGEAQRPAALKRLADLYEKMGVPDKARRAREDLRRRYPD